VHDDFDSQLPDDLRSIADALARERDVADGHLLERVLRRVAPAPGERRRRRFVSVRSAATAALAVVCVAGISISHANISAAATALVASITSGTSDSTSGSAAGQVYCGSKSAIGLKGWAPSFRWHIGNISGADDGWSPSVQPTCPSGALSIVLSDTLTVTPGTNLGLGYDFHAANDPAFTLATYAPTFHLSVSCPNGSKSTLTQTLSNGSYYSPANTPDWIATGDKTALAGFQGSIPIPAVCGAGVPVTITGGTFTTTIQVI
jgi:hypothetical protein